MSVRISWRSASIRGVEGAGHRVDPGVGFLDVLANVLVSESIARHRARPTPRMATMMAMVFVFMKLILSRVTL